MNVVMNEYAIGSLKYSSGLEETLFDVYVQKWATFKLENERRLIWIEIPQRKGKHLATKADVPSLLSYDFITKYPYFFDLTLWPLFVVVFFFAVRFVQQLRWILFEGSVYFFRTPADTNDSYVQVIEDWVLLGRHSTSLELITMWWLINAALE